MTLENTVLQNTLAPKEVCIDSLNKEKIGIQAALTQKEEHIETLQDRITELQDERKQSLCQCCNTTIKERNKGKASERRENILKQQTIDNLESKQQKVNQYSMYRNLM